MLPTSSRCVVLVPVGGALDPDCEDALRELERRGYAVWRVRGYSAIDAARNQMASDALAQGFDELMWIDSDAMRSSRAHARPSLHAERSSTTPQPKL